MIADCRTDIYFMRTNQRSSAGLVLLEIKSENKNEKRKTQAQSASNFLVLFVSHFEKKFHFDIHFEVNRKTNPQKTNRNHSFYSLREVKKEKKKKSRSRRMKRPSYKNGINSNCSIFVFLSFVSCSTLARRRPQSFDFTKGNSQTLFTKMGLSWFNLIHFGFFGKHPRLASGRIHKSINLFVCSTVWATLCGLPESMTASHCRMPNTKTNWREWICSMCKRRQRHPCLFASCSFLLPAFTQPNIICCNKHELWSIHSWSVAPAAVGCARFRELSATRCSLYTSVTSRRTEVKSSALLIKADRPSDA